MSEERSPDGSGADSSAHGDGSQDAEALSVASSAEVHPGSRITRLRPVLLLAPPVAVALVEGFLTRFATGLTARLVAAVILAALLTMLVHWLLSAYEQAQVRSARHDAEMLALHRASLDIYGELSLDRILQKVVDQVRRLTGAKYGAMSTIGVNGAIEQFVTSGIDPATREAIGDPPVGKGLLGVPLHGGQVLRVDDLTRDPRFSGLPEHHPDMTSLLAVPISTKRGFRGNLYLTDKADGSPFDDDDEATLGRFADQAAIAIDNADMHTRLSSLAIAEERARIAREMHDGVAQVLAYANAKTQVVRENLVKDRKTEAFRHLDQLAAAAREAYRETREGILALRTTPDADEPLASVLERYLERWREQTSIDVRLEADGTVAVEEAVELQLLRIVQESLSNVRKHADADVALVTLTRDGEEVVVSITDDGRGFDPRTAQRKDAPRFGLAILRERAEGVGGSLRITSQPGDGATVTARIPLKNDHGGIT